MLYFYTILNREGVSLLEERIESLLNVLEDKSVGIAVGVLKDGDVIFKRSEEHTSELQSRLGPN